MRIGILCEGEYTDVPVIKKILEYFFPIDQYKCSFIIQGVSKKDIFSAADIHLYKMYERHNIQRALIIWDLLPLGHRMEIVSQWSEKPNRAEQRHMLLELLCQSGCLPEMFRQQAQHLACRYSLNNEEYVTHPNRGVDLFKLACICYAMDGWLLSDHSVLCALSSTKERTVEKLDYRPDEPERCQQPASALRRAFRDAPNKHFRYYNKETHNIRIVQKYIEMDKIQKMRNVMSFCRVIDTIEEWLR